MEILLVGGKTYAENMAEQSAARFARIDALAVDRSVVPPEHTLRELEGSDLAHSNRTRERVKAAKAVKGDGLPMQLPAILYGLVVAANSRGEGTRER